MAEVSERAGGAGPRPGPRPRLLAGPRRGPGRRGPGPGLGAGPQYGSRRSPRGAGLHRQSPPARVPPLPGATSRAAVRMCGAGVGGAGWSGGGGGGEGARARSFPPPAPRPQRPPRVCQLRGPRFPTGPCLTGPPPADPTSGAEAPPRGALPAESSPSGPQPLTLSTPDSAALAVQSRAPSGPLTLPSPHPPALTSRNLAPSNPTHSPPPGAGPAESRSCRIPGPRAGLELPPGVSPARRAAFSRGLKLLLGAFSLCP